MIKLTKIVIIAALFIMFQLPAMAAEGTWVWDAPEVTGTFSEAVEHNFRYRVVGDTEWVYVPSLLPDTRYTMSMVPNVTYEAQSAGVDARGRQGEWSEVSEPETYNTPGPGCKPRVVY